MADLLGRDPAEFQRRSVAGHRLLQGLRIVAAAVILPPRVLRI
jgi:hypothetical protein